jgi:negative regulator of flagellin synthesis FlgM
MAIHNINNLMNNHSGKVTTGTASQSGSVSNPAEVDAQAKSQPRQDAVLLTDQAQGLNKLQQRIKDAPSTNQNKVEGLKAAIEKGNYKVDSQRVAQKMMDLESGLESLYK